MLRTKNPQEAQKAIERGKIVMADWVGRRVRINSLCHAEDQRWLAKWSHKDYIHARYDDVIVGQDELLIYGEYESPEED